MQFCLLYHMGVKWPQYSVILGIIIYNQLTLAMFHTSCIVLLKTMTVNFGLMCSKVIFSFSSEVINHIMVKLYYLNFYVISIGPRGVWIYYFAYILNCSDEMQHVSSGVQKLEKREKAAHYSLLAEEQQCTKLLSRVSSAQKELLKWLHCLAKLPAEFKNVVIFIY